MKMRALSIVFVVSLALTVILAFASAPTRDAVLASGAAIEPPDITSLAQGPSATPSRDNEQRKEIIASLNGKLAEAQVRLLRTSEEQAAAVRHQWRVPKARDSSSNDVAQRQALILEQLRSRVALVKRYLAAAQLAENKEQRAPQQQWCEVLQDEATPDECDRYGAAVEHLRKGAAALNPPKSMEEGETRQVHFAISRGSTSPLGMVPGPIEQKRALQIKVGRRMAAELQGDGIFVKPLSSTVQDLGAAETATWTWEIKALPAKQHSLQLTTYVEIPDESGTLERAWAKTDSYDVTVDVGWSEHLSRTLSGAITWGH